LKKLLSLLGLNIHVRDLGCLFVQGHQNQASNTRETLKFQTFQMKMTWTTLM